MRKEMCPDCGRERPVVRIKYRFKECGVPNVLLQGIDVIRCPQCGDSPILPNLRGLLRALSLALIKKPVRLRGEEIRFLRKRVDKTGLEFSKLLHVDNSTLSKWEHNDDPVGDQSDRLIRLLTMALDPELREELRGAVESFPAIRHRKSPMRVEIDTSELSYRYA